MKNWIIYLLIIILSMACNSSAQEINLTPSVLKEKFGFQYLKADSLPEELKKELFIPFLENGKYYISDFEGNRVSNQDYDEIILFYFAPYYMGRIGENYYLYTFPETRIYSEPFKSKLSINNFKSGDAVGYPLAP